MISTVQVQRLQFPNHEHPRKNAICPCLPLCWRGTSYFHSVHDIPITFTQSIGIKWPVVFTNSDTGGNRRSLLCHQWDAGPLQCLGIIPHTTSEPNEPSQNIGKTKESNRLKKKKMEFFEEKNHKMLTYPPGMGFVNSLIFLGLFLFGRKEKVFYYVNNC